MIIELIKNEKKLVFENFDTHQEVIPRECFSAKG